MWDFAHIKEGDQIVTNRGTTELLGIGTVVAPYKFTPSVEYGHRIPVEWEDTTPRQINEGGWRRTLVSSNQRNSSGIAQRFAVRRLDPKPIHVGRLCE